MRVIFASTSATALIVSIFSALSLVVQKKSKPLKAQTKILKIA